MLALVNYNRRQFNRGYWLSRLVSFDIDLVFFIVELRNVSHLLKFNGITPMPINTLQSVKLITNYDRRFTSFKNYCLKFLKPFTTHSRSILILHDLPPCIMCHFRDCKLLSKFFKQNGAC